MAIGAEVNGFLQAYLAVQKQKADAAHNEALRKYYEALARRGDSGQNNGRSTGGLSADDQRTYDQGRSSSPFAQTPPAGNAPASGGATGDYGDTHRLVMNELIGRGVPAPVAAGAVGSMMGESGQGLDPTSYNPDDNGGPSAGIANWHGPRLRNLYNFAGSRNIGGIGADTQARFLGQELDGPYADVLDALRNATTPAQGNDIWTRFFESPRNPDAQVQARATNGPRFFDWWQNNQPTAQAQQAQAPQAATPQASTPPASTPAQAPLAYAPPAPDEGGDQGYADGGLVSQLAQNFPVFANSGSLPAFANSGTPGYADGGSVDDEEDSAPPQSAIPLPGEASVSSPGTNSANYDYAPDLLQGVANGIGHVIHDGLTYLQTAFGLDGHGALPADARQAQGARAFQAGAGAMSDDEVKAIRQTVDPEDKLKEGLADAAGMKALYDHYLTQGQPQKARAMAGAMLQHFSNLASQYGDEALGLMQKGDTPGAVAALTKGYQSIPDGRTVSTQANKDGTYNVTQSDAAGRVIQQARVTPQDLAGFAFRLKNKQAYWQTLADAAEGRFGGAPQESAASQQYWDAQAGGRQAIPAPPQANPGMQSGVQAQPAPTPAQSPTPVQSADSPISPDQALALHAQNNPEPRLPANFAQMSRPEQAGIRADVIQRHQAWLRDRATVANEAKQNYGAWVKENAPDNIDMTSPENVGLVRDAVSGALSSSSKDLDWNLAQLPRDTAASVASGLQSGTVEALRYNKTLTPDQAARNILDLVKVNPGGAGETRGPTNWKAVPTGDPLGRVRVQFNDGRNFYLPQNAMPVIDTMRGVNLQAAQEARRQSMMKLQRQQQAQERNSAYFGR